MMSSLFGCPCRFGGGGFCSIFLILCLICRFCRIYITPISYNAHDIDYLCSVFGQVAAGGAASSEKKTEYGKHCREWRGVGEVVTSPATFCFAPHNSANDQRQC